MQQQIDMGLDGLRSKIVAMGRAVEKAVEESTLGLLERNTGRLDRVRSLEDTINQFHLEIDEKCLKLLANKALLPADLRLVLAIIKINADLERMGDQAVNIAFNVRDYLAKPAMSQDKRLCQMAENVRQMVADSLIAFAGGDVPLGEDVLMQDDAVDSGKHEMFKSLIASMKQDTAVIEGAIDLLLISRNLERLGDHATNIAEGVIFVSTGKDIRHGGFAANA